MLVTADDFERLTSAAMQLDQGEGHIWHRQFGRFENSYADRPDQAPRKMWEWGHWLEEGWASVVLARQFLLDNGHEFEIFYDTTFPNQWGGWVIFTDYHRE